MNFQAPRFALEGATSQSTLNRFMRKTQLHLGLASVHAMTSTNQPQRNDGGSTEGTRNDARHLLGDMPTSPMSFVITDEFAEEFFMTHRGDRRARQETVRLSQELAATRAEAARLADEIHRLALDVRAP